MKLKKRKFGGEGCTDSVFCSRSSVNRRVCRIKVWKVERIPVIGSEILVDVSLEISDTFFFSSLLVKYRTPVVEDHVEKRKLFRRNVIVSGSCFSFKLFMMALKIKHTRVN